MVDKELEGALAKIRERKIDEALAMIQEEAGKHPEWAPPRLILARLLFGTDQAALGRRALEQAAAEAPDYADIYLTFGSLALGESRISDARLNFENVFKLVETGHWNDSQKRAFRREAHAGLVSVAEAREDWNGALAQLGQWLALEPKNGQARQRKGRALFQLGKSDEAFKELTQAVKDTPTLDPAGVSMAWLYNQKANVAKASEWFDFAIKAEPQNPRARIAYATWLLDRGRAADARSSVDLALRLAPDSTDGRRLQALVAWHLGELKNAVKILEPMHRELPADLSLTNLLALALVDQDDLTKRAGPATGRGRRPSISALAGDPGHSRLGALPHGSPRPGRASPPHGRIRRSHDARYRLLPGAGPFRQGQPGRRAEASGDGDQARRCLRPSRRRRLAARVPGEMKCTGAGGRARFHASPGQFANMAHEQPVLRRSLIRIQSVRRSNLR